MQCFTVKCCWVKGIMSTILFLAFTVLKVMLVIPLIMYPIHLHRYARVNHKDRYLS